MSLRALTCFLALTTGLCLVVKPSFAVSASIAELKNNPAVRAAIAACRGDAEKYCGGVMPGGGRIMRCLAGQSASLAPSCKAALSDARDALIKSGVILAKAKPVQ
jgi:hypothetical protein